VQERLGEKDRQLAEQLKQRSISQISAADGTPRSTLQHRVRRLLRPFEDEGLREYL
jgi:hypothetical protein